MIIVHNRIYNSTDALVIIKIVNNNNNNNGYRLSIPLLLISINNKTCNEREMTILTD